MLNPGRPGIRSHRSLQQPRREGAAWISQEFGAPTPVNPPVTLHGQVRALPGARGAVTSPPASASGLRSAATPPTPTPPPPGPIKSNLVMAGLRLLLLLAPLACALTSEPAPRFWNLRLEPDELRLTWNGEVSSRSNQIACRKGVETPVLASNSECVFPSLSLCHMTNFSVFLREDPDSAASIQFPESGDINDPVTSETPPLIPAL
ncbi:Interleukin-3 receptor subunit alpha [Lemmus lemmus]